VLIGEPRQMVEALQRRRERLGVESVIVVGSIDLQRFCTEVLPHVS
jgi:hypothetical protein